MVQLTILFPSDFEKSSIKRHHSLLIKGSNLNSCFLQQKTPLEKKRRFKSIDTLVLSTTSGIAWFHYLWGTSWFVKGTHQGSIYSVLCHSYGVCNFSCHHSLVSIWKKFYFGIRVFIPSGNCCISTAGNLSFSGECFGVIGTTWQSPNCDFNLRKRFLLSPELQVVWIEYEGKWSRIKRCNFLKDITVEFIKKNSWSNVFITSSS